MFYRKCSKCSWLKVIVYYFKDSKSRDGYQSQCKTCKAKSVKNSPSQKSGAYRKTEKYRAGRRAYFHKTKLARNISRRMRQSLNGERKSLSWCLLVNYTLEELRIHLERGFDINMSWDNYGTYWNIDHKKPLSLFNITSDRCDDFKKCWDLDNLQPMVAVDNFKKSNKYYGALE